MHRSTYIIYYLYVYHIWYLPRIPKRSYLTGAHHRNPEKPPAVVWPLLGGNVEMIHWKLGGLKHFYFNPYLEIHDANLTKISQLGLKPPTRKGQGDVFFSNKVYGSQIHRLLRARADPSAANVREPKATRGVCRRHCITELLREEILHHLGCITL